MTSMLTPRSQKTSSCLDPQLRLYSGLSPTKKMWSYVQRRQIANQVRLDHQKDIESAEHVRPSLLKRSFSPPSNTRTSEEGSQQESSESRFQVQSAGEDDPLNPLNWSRSGRAKNVFIICFLVFTQCWAGSAISMGNSMASEEFHVSQVAENLSTAMFLFGVGTGALFAGPISETIGRNPTYLVATALYLCFVLGSAMTPTFGGQVVCRFLVGLSASATLTINGASVNDQFRPVKRALVFPIVAWANVAAPVIAPIAGGWIVSNPNLGWRWTEWITLIISGAAFIVALFFLPETYFPLILSWKAKELRRITGDQRYTSQHEQKHSFWKQLKKTLPLPATFFLSEPVIIVLGLYLILLYILLFSFLSGFDYIFKHTYGLEPGYQGSCFAAIAAGATAFVLCGPGLYEWARQHTERVKGASIQPEFRLWPAIVTAPFLPVALFWLGWTNYRSISIWSGLVACFLFGIVLASIYVSSYEYITDSYGEHSAIALGSITMSRYLIAGGMVMAARPMYEVVGSESCEAAVAVHPVLEALGIHQSPADKKLPRIWWTTSGLMALMPIHAAGDHTSEAAPNTFNFVIPSYTTTLRALAYARENEWKPLRGTDCDFAFIASPNNARSKAPLTVEESARELDDVVRQHCRTQVVVGPTKPETLSILESCNAVYFGCHGESMSTQPCKSYLQLGTDAESHLTIQEIQGSRHQKAQLAYLSACSTANMSARDLVDEVVHIAGAFSLLGFRQVVGTFWQAKNTAARVVAKRFYEELMLGDGCDEDCVARAYYTAVMELRGSNVRDPLVWATFAHFGA
ncbi:hypothetical protein FOXB_15716 [Fusarium oxysporum f. sp. conglutinans Fo5176]|uniref:Major facilitator superfamily (MFS) profile domain-containing protein n=1 Tax=Fusarium oxysporum (strain Fo5176) TaxID=660025 RepID=F9GAN4_FUSOF|nr:hypothetical protein FOXB_15716 [Fusarium oxysporum f. sp. conglutinans Fo5176]